MMMMMLLPPDVTAQQTTTTTTTSSGTSASAQSSALPDALGDFEVISNVELGARILGIDGSREKYYSDLNYRAGFKIFDSSVLVRAKDGRGKLFDTLLVTSNGFDADPYGVARVNIEKTRWYKFDAHFRRNAYDNYIGCCNFAAARAAQPNIVRVGVSQNWSRTKHKIGDFDLKLLPQNKNIRFNLGYSADRSRGPGGGSLSFARDDFALAKEWRSRSDEVRGGFESKIGGLDLAFTQGFRWYRDDTAFFSGPTSGNNPASFNSLTSYLRTQPSRGRAWYSRVSAHTQFANRFDITARYIHTNSRLRYTFKEDATGRGNLESRNVFIDRNLVTASSDEIERPTHLFDVGFTARVTDKLRISNTFRYNSFNVTGETAYTDARFLANLTLVAGVPVRGALVTPYPIVINLNPSRELKLRRWENSLEVDYEFGPRFGFFVGHRYQDRRQQITARQRVYPLTFTAAPGNPLGTGSSPADALAFLHEEDVENSTNGFFGGFKAKPTKNWNIWFDANRGTSDNAFTRVDYYDTISFRLRSRLAIRKGLNFSASIVTRDNDNPGVVDEQLLGVPEFDVDISSRTFTSALDWNSNDKVWLSAGYTFQHVTSDIGVIINTSPIRFGRSVFYLRDHFFFFNTSVRLHPRVALYASYRGHDDQGQGDRPNSDAAGVFIRSLPLRFQAPEARFVFRLNRRLDWTVGYQYFDYKEKFRGLVPDVFAINQDYRAHLPYTSLRFYFGRTDR